MSRPDDGQPVQWILLFPSIHHVMAAEANLLACGVKVDLAPVPRSISSDCGMAVALDESSYRAARAILAGANLPPFRLARRVGGEYRIVEPEP